MCVRYVVACVTRVSLYDLINMGLAPLLLDTQVQLLFASHIGLIPLQCCAVCAYSMNVGTCVSKVSFEDRFVLKMSTGFAVYRGGSRPQRISRALTAHGSMNDQKKQPAKYRSRRLIP